MPLPPSFARDGFITPKQRLHRVLIGTEGGAHTGKTEFGWSCPGPGIHLALDRGYDAALDNPNPPSTRNADAFAIVPVNIPLATQADIAGYRTWWAKFYAEFYLKALNNAEARTVILDGDSDSFELQTLAEFGKTTQIMPIQRTGLNAARRAMIARAWDSGKIVICTNKLKRKYEDVIDEGTGKPKVGVDGKNVREWDGVTYERQGFWDHEYLFQIQLKHLYEPAKVVENGRRTKEIPPQWGIHIQMCKANRPCEGMELWGDDCNFATLMQLVYPQIPLADWGF